MKRFIIALTLVLAFAFAAQAEQVVTITPDSVTVLKTKAGEDYVRMLVSEKKTANGITFAQSTTYNAYRENVPAASKCKPGTPITAVVEKREYQGRSYFTILGIKSAVASK